MNAVVFLNILNLFFMKKLIFFLALSLSINFAKAQADRPVAITGTPIEMLFPQGKSKALILSFDDGRVADKDLVKLMNEYGLVGTFHLNSNKLGTKDYLTKEEIKSLYKGHEVSGHTANHPALTSLSKIDVIYEVVEDRKELERLMGYPVRGMSYPFGNTNDVVVEAITGLGIEYARTVGDTYNFNMPTEFLRWQPTIHLFGKTNYIVSIRPWTYCRVIFSPLPLVKNQHDERAKNIRMGISPY